MYRYSSVAWTDVSAGIPTSRIRSLTINSRYVYTGPEVAGVYRRELSQLDPLGSTRHLGTGPGTIDFHDASNPTWTTIEFSSVSGNGNVVVMHFGSPATAPQSSGTAPAHLSQYRWVIQQTGLVSCTAEVRFNVTPYLPGMPHPSSVTICARPAEDGGQFVPLAMMYVGAPHELTATTTEFTEFVLGSDDNPLTSPAEPQMVPATADLVSIWPNPFNPRTAIGLALACGGCVTLTVYDLLGRDVSVLVDGETGRRRS